MSSFQSRTHCRQMGESPIPLPCNVVLMDLVALLRTVPEFNGEVFMVNISRCGTRVTVKRSSVVRGYWQLRDNALVWTYASASQPNVVTNSIDEAALKTIELTFAAILTRRTAPQFQSEPPGKPRSSHGWGRMTGAFGACRGVGIGFLADETARQ